MSKIEQLRSKVKELYVSDNPDQDAWSDWLYENHVLVVAMYAQKLAEKYEAHRELCEAAALLHDIADTQMRRTNPDHEKTSIDIARSLLAGTGFTPEEITVVVDDAITLHSCRNNQRPTSQVGLVLATADALAHLQTDFYFFAAWAYGKDRSFDDFKTWAFEKIDRDLYNKIAFEDERDEAQQSYEAIKRLLQSDSKGL